MPLSAVHNVQFNYPLTAHQLTHCSLFSKKVLGFDADSNTKKSWVTFFHLSLAAVMLKTKMLSVDVFEDVDIRSWLQNS